MEGKVVVYAMAVSFLMTLPFVTIVINEITPAVLALYSDVDATQSVIWGPGLKSDIVLPVRYFFVQLVDKNGVNKTVSVGQEPFNVNIRKKDNERTRIWIQVLDRQDGSYIVRYKLYESYQNLVIDISLNGQPLAQSPYHLKGEVSDEKCDCPADDIDEWLNKYQCKKTDRQIKTDLADFTKIDMNDLAPKMVQLSRNALCRYVIKDNKVYRKTHGDIVDFKMFSDAMLLSLTRKVRLPDVDFFVNLGDWPLVKRSSGKILPMFSWCGSDETRDIVMPTYDVTESTLETMGRVSLDLLAVQANTGPPWENKSNMAFWRGRDSRQERLDLVKMSLDNPEVLDAKLTNMFFFKHDPKVHGKIIKHISFYDFFKHKYQVTLDGTVAAYRLPYLLAGDAVVLKQDSHYYEHFYKHLKPYEHYIPVKRDLSNLLEQIKWAKEYSRRLTSPVKVVDGMELVPQPKESNCKCRPTKVTLGATSGAKEEL